MIHRTHFLAAILALSTACSFSQNISSITIANSTVYESGAGNSTNCTITLDSTVGSNFTVYVGSRDPSELSVPGNVVVTTGHNSTTFTVRGVPDGVFDLNAGMDIGATVIFTTEPYNNAQYNSDAFYVMNTDPAPSPSALVLSQYYERTGLSDDNYIEIANRSGAAINLNDYVLAIYKGDNTNAEGWKYENSTSPEQFNFDSSFVVPANGTLLLKATDAANPSYANATATPLDLLANISGDDSVVLYSNSDFSAANIIDVVSFTAAAGGANTSFIRITNNSSGYDTLPGSDILDANTVWQQVTLSSVDSANSTTSAYLGFYQSGGINPNTFSGYMATYGLSGGNATTTANPDNDAFNNLSEYAFDLNPNIKEYGRLLGYTNQTAGNYTITLSFTRDADKTDLDYLVKRSSNPTFTGNTIIASSLNGTATTGLPGVGVSESPQPGNKYNVNVTYNGSTSTDPRQFFEVEPSL